MIPKTLHAAPALLLLSSLLPAQVHEGAGVCSSGVVRLCYGEHASCSLSSPSEIDVYRFAGTAGDQVRVSVSGTGTSCLDCKFEVFDAGGMPVFSNSCDTDCFSTNQCTATSANLSLPIDGDYSLMIHDAGLNNTGSVSVTVTCIVGACLPNWVPVGANYCTTNPNSTGDPAAIQAWGSDLLSDDTLFLCASDAPRNVSGIFFMGPNQVSTTLGSGARCVGGMVLRFPLVNACNRGELRREVDFLSLPQGIRFQPGETWNFQAWFRDGQMSNTSDALEITFQ